MEENKAPENNKRKAPDKIYACFGVFGLIQATEISVTSIDIEYTRTDAFIEKVSWWLKDCATFTDMNGKKRIDKEMYKATVEDFKKYMKGE